MNRFEIYETGSEGMDRAEFAVLDTAQLDDYGDAIAICYIHVTKDVSKDYETRLDLARDIAEGVVREREENRFSTDFAEVESLIDADEFEKAQERLDTLTEVLGSTHPRIVRLQTIVSLLTHP